MLVLIAVCVGTPPTPATGQDVPFTPSWYMVVDRANLLDEGQERSAIDNAWRLNMIGTPTQVVTELAQSTPELAGQRASELRLANAIETSPGADDGILVYAAVNPADRSIVEVAISTGVNAVPRGGLTAESVVGIRTGIVAPQLLAEHPARAVVYSLREMHYLQIFAPPPVEPLEGWRSTLHSIVPFAGPVVSAMTAAWLFVQTRGMTNLRTAIVPLALASIVALILAITSLIARAPLGILSALLLAAGVIGFAIWLDQPRSSAGGRVLTVTPRPPGQMRPLSRMTPR